jgi:hypothetical protein
MSQRSDAIIFLAFFAKNFAYFAVKSFFFLKPEAEA